MKLFDHSRYNRNRGSYRNVHLNFLRQLEDGLLLKVGITIWETGWNLVEAWCEATR